MATAFATKNEKPRHERSPCFFRIINHQLSTTQQLMIPPQVASILKDPLGTVTLKGPSGDLWNAKVFRKPDGVYLQDGWQQFVRDNSLGNHEFLVFRYTGKMFFSVQIFDQSGCERMGLSRCKRPRAHSILSVSRKNACISSREISSCRIRRESLGK